MSEDDRDNDVDVQGSTIMNERVLDDEVWVVTAAADGDDVSADWIRSVPLFSHDVSADWISSVPLFSHDVVSADWISSGPLFSRFRLSATPSFCGATVK